MTHPETGVVLSVGTDSYRPPEALQRWIRLRDGTCRFPGCSRRAEHAEIDHMVDAALGGPTNHDNLISLCTGHHKLKHASEWTVRGHASIPGAFVWESPLGKEYTTYPATDLLAPAAWALSFSHREGPPHSSVHRFARGARDAVQSSGGFDAHRADRRPRPSPSCAPSRGAAAPLSRSA